MKIIFLGAGNVAAHLVKALFEKGVNVAQIYNRTRQKAKIIAAPYDISYTDKISEIQKADLYFITTSDDFVETVSGHIAFDDSLVVHTAGSLSISALKGSYRKGVVYPLQTFSTDSIIAYEKIPFFIEAEHEQDYTILENLMLKISKSVSRTTAGQRAKLHLSAVFVSNFVNYMYCVGYKLCEQAQISFQTLLPLIDQTAQKVQDISPLNAQTGPAKRNDQTVMKKQMKMLEGQPDFLTIYRLLSDQILK